MTGLGALTALTITTRVTDGVALLVSVASILCFLLREKKIAGVVLYIAVTAALVFAVVAFTRDPFTTYLSTTVFRAAASKGGPHGLTVSPFLCLWNVPGALRAQGVQVTVILAGVFGVGLLARRFPKVGERGTLAVQLGTLLVLYAMQPGSVRQAIRWGTLFNATVLWLAAGLYVFAILVLARILQAKRQHRAWDRREAMYLLPLAEWASYAAGAAAEPLTSYYAPIALLLLLMLALQPFRRYEPTATSSLLTVLVILGVFGLGGKMLIPYRWQNYLYPEMFRNRVWYEHPVYGRMYLDKDLLQFSERICGDIHAGAGEAPELLSLPYPYPNYFCDTAPWHDYVQTFFDTSTRDTIQHLMEELRTAPPQWIVYQRQMGIMKGAERLYNHRQPLAQRDLDALIFSKIHDGSWTLVDQSNYLGNKDGGNGWFVIRTRP